MTNILEVGLWRKEDHLIAWTSLSFIEGNHDILSKINKLEKDLIALETNYRFSICCKYQKKPST